MSGTHDGCPRVRVTVTTDARTAELLRDAGLKPVEVPELDEGILNQLVADYETTIFPAATLEPLARARRLALELKRRGSRPRMVRCDRLSGALAELVTTDAGRAEVRQLIADAPLCGFPELEDEPSSTSASVVDAPALPEDILPPKVGALVDHFARACDAKRDLVLLAALAALAAALGANWKVGARSMVRSAVLWFVLVAPAGMAKSPASKPLLKPLHDIDRSLGSEHRKAWAAYETELRDWKRSKKGTDAKPEKPLRQRVALTDATPEGLAAALAGSPFGILLHSDEVARLLASMDAYHVRQGIGRGFYLSLWSQERHAEGRKGADESESDDPFSVIYGTIQPTVVCRLELADGDGLCARFLWFFVLPSVHGLGHDLDPALVERWDRVIRLPRQHRVDSVQKLDPDATEYVDSLLRAWSRRAQDLDAAGAGLLSSMFGKAGDHLMRLTALLHGIDAIETALSDSPERPPPLQASAVPLATVRRAACLVETFLAHGSHVAELVLQHSPDSGTAAEDRQIECHLRGLLPAGVAIEAEPAAWTEALAMVGVSRSSTKIGRAFARLAAKRLPGLAVTRSVRGSERGWCVRHDPIPELASLVTEASASPTAIGAGPFASDTNDTSRPASLPTPADVQRPADQNGSVDGARDPASPDGRRATAPADFEEGGAP